MRSFYFLIALIGVVVFSVSSCTEDTPTTSEVADNEITPFYPNGGSGGDSGGATTGGGDTGGDTGGALEVIL